MHDEKQPDSQPKLSLLLATVENRAAIFALLHAELLKQAEGKPVEILVACDAKQISIGKKRQNLLEQATGDYVASIDDDDWISTDYVDRMLKAAEAGKDCIGFEIQCTFNDSKPVKACTSMKYKIWGEHEDGYRFTRSIYHKSGVRREMALKAGFPDMRYGEDKIFSQAVMRLVKTEEFIPHVMYYYRFKSEPFAEKYGLPRAMERRLVGGKGIDLNHVRRKFHT